MGFNKVIFCLNDAQGEIDRNPSGWWAACTAAFWELWNKHRDANGDKQPQPFSCGSYSQYWQAVWEEHADITGVIMVGRNSTTVIGSSLYGGHHTEEGQIKILKEILEKKGYRIVKKPNRKGTSKSGSRSI